MPSANNSLIDCFYRIIAVKRRVNPRIGVRKGYPSAGLGIFLDKRVGFAGGGANIGVMAVIVVTALWIHTDGNAGGLFRSGADCSGVERGGKWLERGLWRSALCQEQML
ncbi:hypothetical protein B9T65_03010 [Serratia marcescens]|nr:hypothetical protein AR325_18825 [Serratia marcescens]PHI52419.1 hypothetical protein B9T65_03010 [Serratia marcescens]PNU32824.1 hypothetical protein C2M05_17830 [Serratia marcescens]